MCGDLKDNGFYKLIYLNAWFLVSGTVWEGFGGVALLEEGCHRRWALRFQILTSFSVSSLCSVLEN